jgi:tetratricopeptide (TPR) repeat protein
MELSDDLVAALAGRYKVERELGRGGMATVYLARDLKHDRLVAIKVLPPERFSTTSAERFLLEISTAARLTHPNILPLHDSVATDTVRCYVMPYVVGESLRQRLEREKQLGIDEAVGLARQIAAGLDYAHQRGVVHRDIKPENILLVGEQAMIADFGLARATHTAASSPLTEAGIAVGTPAYMSPEQAAGEHGIDGRADIYALGCVLFELIAGAPPFRGPTMQAMLTQHATRKPPSLCVERDTCPVEIDAVVQKALAKVPADRFRTAGEMIRALDHWRSSGHVVSPPSARQSRSWVRRAVAVAAVAIAGVLLANPVRERLHLGAPEPDSNRVALLPISGRGGTRLTAPLARQRLYAALTRWRDLSIVDSDSAGGSNHSAISVDEGRTVARRNGAGRFVLATLAPLGDSVQLRATLYDARATPLHQQAITLPDSASASDDRYRELTSNLLRVAEVPDDADDGDRGTRQLRAWRAYTRGQAARATWRLEDAEREFRSAVAVDRNFAQAQLWLAQVILWQRPPRNQEWIEPANRALATPGRLSTNDSLLARGAEALGGRRYPEACAAYRALRTRLPQSDLPWYGLAFCLGLDPFIIHDAKSASGWRFRGSTHSAVAAFDSALTRTDGAPTFAYRLLDGLLITEPLRTRRGRALPPDSGMFYAYPSLIADTLAFVPYPAADVQAGGRRVSRITLSAALRHNVERLEIEFTEWVRRAPASADARASLARMQEAGGQPAAIEGGGLTALRTLSEARRLSVDAHQQIALAVSGVRLLIKDDRFTAARSLADSLLAAVPQADASDAAALAGVAALVGNVKRATDLLRTQARAEPEDVFGGQSPPPGPVMDEAVSYLVDAAMGICGDSLAIHQPALERVLRQYVSEDARETVRRVVATRPHSLAVPCLGATVVKSVESIDPLVRMQQQLARHDFASLRAQFDSMRQLRLSDRPGDIALDHTYQEAWLLVAMGDSTGAERYLDAPLTALTTLSSHLLDDVPRAAALGRAMALRSELAAARGDRLTARRFADKVIALWSGASPSLQGIVSRMREISKTGR